MTGRRSKLTSKRKAIILDAIREGNTKACAAGLAGISRDTLTNWLNRGRDDEKGTYFDFLRAFKSAEAEAEQAACAVVKAAMPDTWQAAAWWLERRRSADYGRPTRDTTVKVDTGKGTAQVEVVIGGTPPE